MELGAVWERAPGMPLTVVFPKRAEQAAAYRFVENGRVTGEDILHPYRREALAERCREEGTVLLAQDTTTLNYTSCCIPDYLGTAISGLNGRRGAGSSGLLASGWGASVSWKTASARRKRKGSGGA